MKILILGSEGFIGSAAVRYFIQQGAEVTGCDLFEAPAIPGNYRYQKLSRLSPELDEVLGLQQFDVFINAAGSGNVSYSVTHPFIDFEANTLDVYRILDAIRRLQTSCKYIQLSSAAVYGNPVELPVKETAACQPVSPYGYHKLMAELVCREFYELYNVPVAIIRPFSVYGPGLRKQLFWDLFRKYKSGQSPVEVWGTGNESRDFIFIEDLMRCIHIIIDRSPFNCSVYNAGSEKEITIRDAVTMLFSNLDPSATVLFNQQVREGDPLNWRSSAISIKEIGFSVETEFEQGIKKLAEWYKSLS